MRVKRGQRYRRVKHGPATCRITTRRGDLVYYTGTDVDDGHSPGLFGGKWCCPEDLFLERWNRVEEGEA